MRQHFHKLAMIAVLGSGFALAQTTPQQPSASQAPNSPTTQSPSTSDQQPSSTSPSQSTLPNTDQTGQTGQSTNPSSSGQSSQPGQSGQSGQSLPQSDASPSATGNANATGDVQNTIQSALQKDPTLSSANITVDVKNGKMVTLTGTVPSKDAKDTAERIAKENANGMKIKNHLKVASSENPNPSPKGDMSNPK